MNNILVLCLIGLLIVIFAGLFISRYPAEYEERFRTCMIDGYKIEMIILVKRPLGSSVTTGVYCYDMAKVVYEVEETQ